MSAARRRVLFLIPTLTGGGSERVVTTLLQHLDRRRFQLALAVVDIRGAVFRHEVPDDVEFIDLGCKRVLHAMPRLVRLLWSRRPHVLVSTLGHLNLAIAILRPLLPSTTRYVARESTIVSHVTTDHGRPSLWASAYRRYYRRFDRVICQSLAMRDDLVLNFNVEQRRISVIHNPLDVGRISAAAAQPLPPGIHWMDSESPRDRERHLVAAGRLVQQKGFHLMIEALALTRKDGLHLTILGEGPERSNLEALAQAQGVGRRVHFVDFQSNPFAFFARAGALLLSSRYEGFPNVALEALSCGTPVVALPIPGGLGEIVQGVPGCVLAHGSTAADLAGALDQWQPVRVPSQAVDRFAIDSIVSEYAAELSA